MWRYIGTAAVAALLLALAIRSRDAATGGSGVEPSESAAPHAEPEVDAVSVPGGVDLSVRQRLAYSVSRASLVYELNGSEQTLDETTQCQKALESETSAGADRSYECEVFLAGKVPAGASDVRIVLEDETGTTVRSIRWQASP
jgi:hypothetical protein